MVSILIVADDGQVFAMSNNIKTCLKCLESVKHGAHATYITNNEKRLAYLGRAWEKIEGAGISE
jgi:hypothetical protein